MKTKGINKDLDKVHFKHGTEEQIEIEIRMKSMMVSCFVYGSIERDSYDFNRYIKKSGNGLSNEVFEEVYKEQYDFLKNHCIIVRGTFTDSEGCTYNSLKYY